MVNFVDTIVVVDTDWSCEKIVNEPFLIENEWSEWSHGFLEAAPSKYCGWYCKCKHFPEASLLSPDINIYRGNTGVYLVGQKTQLYSGP